jgi:hypothetical protein
MAHFEAHERLDQMALDLVFNANTIVELGAAAPVSPRQLRSAADDLQREADRLSAVLRDDDRALRFARLVLDELEHELDRAVFELPMRGVEAPGNGSPSASTAQLGT